MRTALKLAAQAEERRKASTANHPMRRRHDRPAPRSTWDSIGRPIVWSACILAVGLALIALMACELAR